jgi:hypothetical protein
MVLVLHKEMNIELESAAIKRNSTAGRTSEMRGSLELPDSWLQRFHTVPNHYIDDLHSAKLQYQAPNINHEAEISLIQFLM